MRQYEDNHINSSMRAPPRSDPLCRPPGNQSLQQQTLPVRAPIAWKSFEAKGLRSRKTAAPGGIGFLQSLRHQGYRGFDDQEKDMGDMQGGREFTDCPRDACLTLVVFSR